MADAPEGFVADQTVPEGFVADVEPQKQANTDQFSPTLNLPGPKDTFLIRGPGGAPAILTPPKPAEPTSYLMRAPSQGVLMDPASGPPMLVRKPKLAVEGLYNTLQKNLGALTSPFAAALGPAAKLSGPLAPAVTGALAVQGVRGLTEGAPPSLPTTATPGERVERGGDIAGQALLAAAPLLHPASERVGQFLEARRQGRLLAAPSPGVIPEPTPAPPIPPEGLRRLRKAVRTTIAKPLEAGQKAAAQGKTLADNPYVEGSAEEASWIRGFNEAQPKPPAVTAKPPEAAPPMAPTPKPPETVTPKVTETTPPAPKTEAPKTAESPPAVAAATPTPPGPGMVGMGGAEVGEVGEGSATSLKNAQGDLERAGLDLSAAPVHEVQNMTESWMRADRTEQVNPGTGEALAKRLQEDPSIRLSGDDSALLLRYKRDLLNKINNAAEATHVGDSKSREAALKTHDALTLTLNNLMDSIKQAGSFPALEMRWRQALVKENFTFQSRDDLNRFSRTISGEDLPGDKLGEADQKATAVNDAQGQADQAERAVVENLDQKAPDQRSMTKAERDAFDAANKTVRENAVRIADLENKQRVATTKEEKATLDVQLKAAQRAQVAAEKTVRENAARLAKAERQVKERADLDVQAKAERDARNAADKTVRDAARALRDAEVKSRTAKTKAERKEAAVQAKAAQKALDAADKAHRDAAAKLAATERKLMGDPIKAVWAKVREVIDSGETDPVEIRKKVAYELGIRISKVQELLARDPNTKRLLDDAWMKQQRATRLRQDAKMWVIGAKTPEFLKYIKSAPRATFGLTVLGHGYVPLGTHAPLVVYDPRFTKLYFQRYRTLYKLATPGAIGKRIGVETGDSFYRAQMEDLQNRPNYVAGRRGGLQTDVTEREEYVSPEVMKAILGGKAGVRGFSVLKTLRQDMFDYHWNKLPRSLQTDEMASSISRIVNHLTGVTETRAPKFLGSLAFAPRLLGSRFANIILDPAKAVGVFGKSAIHGIAPEWNWARVSPAEKHFAVEQVIHKSLIAGTYGALLGMNQAMLTATGSDQKINFTDPLRSDFLKFKGFGMTFSYGNAFLAMMKLPYSLYRVISSDGGKTKNLVYADESIATTLFRYGRTQLHPFTGTLMDLAIGSDYESRPLPRTGFGLFEQQRPVPKRLAAQGMEPYSWGEYWSEKGPIPTQEVMKDVWRNGLGLSDEEVKGLAKAMAIMSVMGGTGGRLTEDILPPQQ